jgi:hypothetical protein
LQNLDIKSDRFFDIGYGFFTSFSLTDTTGQTWYFDNKMGTKMNRKKADDSKALSTEVISSQVTQHQLLSNPELRGAIVERIRNSDEVVMYERYDVEGYGSVSGNVVTTSAKAEGSGGKLIERGFRFVNNKK